MWRNMHKQHLLVVLRFGLTSAAQIISTIYPAAALFRRPSFKQQLDLREIPVEKISPAGVDEDYSVDA